MRTSGTERVDLRELFSRLYSVGVTSVLIEGGAGLAWGALQAGVVDRCLFFYAPMIIGGATAPSGSKESVSADWKRRRGWWM